MLHFKSIAACAAALALGLATTAQASEVRSASSLPVKSRAVMKTTAKLKRTSASMQGETSALTHGLLIGGLVVLVGGGIIIAATTGGNDSPGS